MEKEWSLVTLVHILSGTVINQEGYSMLRQNIKSQRGHACVLAQGFDITPDLRRMCSSLMLQQIYKLVSGYL